MRENEAQLRDRYNLFKEISKKMTTTSIGDLAQVEAFFGVIWGHGKPDHTLTDIEKEWKQVWELCRKAMLDHGNKQIRLIQTLLNSYNVVKVPEVTNIGYYDKDGRYQLVKHPIILEDKNGGN